MPSERPFRRAMPTFLPVSFALLAFGCGFAETSDSPQHPTSESTPTRALEAEPPPELKSVEGYGFQPRACGFDLDDDGIVGEPEDCSICDGSTTDPDGDGVDEDLIYVSCPGSGPQSPAPGIDIEGCGSPDRPCASLGFAWALADGPDDGAEDILCFRGVCREPETLEPTTSGLAGVVKVAAEGHQSRDFERPANPAMWVGWDSDGDGQYPPFDGDDEAIFEGSQGAARAIRFRPVADRFELAHFTARGFGSTSDGKDSGLLAFGPGQGELSHLYLHDMFWLETNKGRPAGTSVTTIDLFSEKTRVTWLWLDNIWAPRTGGWFVRGSGLNQGPDGGPFRFSRLTVTARGCDFDDCGTGAAFTGFHLWGYLSGIEIYDSHFDAAVDEWQPKAKGGPSGARFALVAQCSQDWTLRHNLIDDFKNAVRIQGWAERYCDDGAARSVGPVRVDRNWIRNDYQPWTGGDVAVYISEGGDDRQEVVGDVEITHNVFSSPGGWESCIWIQGGNDAGPPEGQISVVNNTCAGRIDYHGAVVIGDTGGDVLRFPHRGIRIVNNLITGLRTEDPNFRITYPPVGLQAERNVFDPAGQFHWLGQTLPDLAAWQEATALDRESKACLPAFENFERGDYRLRADDSCALDVALPAPGIAGIDQIGEPRPESAWDVGALESKLED